MLAGCVVCRCVGVRSWALLVGCGFMVVRLCSVPGHSVLISSRLVSCRKFLVPGEMSKCPRVRVSCVHCGLSLES